MKDGHSLRHFWIAIRPNDIRGDYVTDDEGLVEWDREQGREVIEVIEVPRKEDC